MRGSGTRLGRRSGTALAGIGAVCAALVVLTGCTPVAKIPTPPSTDDTVTATPQSTASPSAPTLDPTGSASDNFAYFQFVMAGWLRANANAKGRQIIDHLVAAGFVKKDMEVTADTTAVGLKADNIEYSVRMNGTCLVGQAGNTGFQAYVAPILSTGHCLIGKTRAIDW